MSDVELKSKKRPGVNEAIALPSFDPAKNIPSNTLQQDLQILATEQGALDLTVGELWDRIDRLELMGKREEALRGAVALHSALNYRSHTSNIDIAVTSTADTLLEWLVKE